MHLKTVGKYIRRSPYQSLAAVLIMTLTMFMISVFSLLTLLSIRLIDYFESSPQLMVFFNLDTKEEDIMSLKAQYEATGKVATVNYIDQKEAVKLYFENTQNDDPILRELVTSEILPASLEIKAVDPKDLAELASISRDLPIIDEVKFEKEIVEDLISWMNAFRIVGIAVIAILVLTAVLVILSIVAFKILVRRDEIDIMKLLGATNWFVRIPFIYEGMFYGFVGAILGWFMSLALLFYATPFLQASLKNAPVLPFPTMLLAEALVIQVAIAVILGAFASFLAVLRYLK
jgi:cell division transport system permease protein